MKMKNPVTKFLASMLCLALAFNVVAQDVEQVAKSDPWVSAGAITMSNIFTWPKDSLKNELPYSYYLSGNLNTTFFGVVSVPVSFSYTNNQYASTYAYPFNRFSIAPSYKWIKTYMGFSSMSFSPYTMSGREFMGGGLELTPPDFPLSFSAYYGRYNKAVAFDSISMKPIYRRMGGGFKIGYRADKFNVSINAVKSVDIESSLSLEKSDSNYIAPKGNIAAGVSAEVHPFDNTTISGQYSVSIVDNDCSSDSTGNSSILSEDDETYHYSAYKMSISQSIGFGSLGVSYERVSPNYTSFSSYYNTDDFWNLTADFSAHIGSMANVGGNVGFQRDNLENNDVNTNSQAIYSCNLQLTPVERLSLSGSVSNVQSYVYIKDIIEEVSETNQYQNLDTLSYTELNFSANGTASYVFGNQEALPQTVTGGYSFQKASHEQKNCERFTDSKLHNINASYQITHVASKTTLGLTGNFNRTITSSLVTDVMTYCVSLNNSFVKNLQAVISLNYNTVSGEKDYEIINARAALTYSFFQNHNVSLNFSMLDNKSMNTGKQYQLNATYTYNFNCGIRRVDDKYKWKSDF